MQSWSARAHHGTGPLAVDFIWGDHDGTVRQRQDPVLGADRHCEARSSTSFSKVTRDVLLLEYPKDRADRAHRLEGQPHPCRTADPDLAGAGRLFGA